MTYNLKGRTLPELIKLQQDVQEAIETFTERAKRDAVAKLEERAKELGFSLASLLGVSALKAKKPVLAKFAHPADPTITWAGRGRKPKWFLEAIASGRTPLSLSIRD